MAEVLDRSNWAGQRTPSLTRFSRSPKEIVATAITAFLLYWFGFEPRIDALAGVAAAAVSAYFAMPLLEWVWNVFRAPSTELQGKALRLTGEVERLSKLEQQVTAFDIRLAHSGPMVVHHPVEMPNKFYVIVNDASITNKSDSQIPIGVSLRIDLSESFAISEVAKATPLPESIRNLCAGFQQLERYVNIPARSASPLGYWAFVFAVKNDFFKIEIDPKTVTDHALYLELENTITGEMRLSPLNTHAHIAEVKKRQHGETQ